MPYAPFFMVHSSMSLDQFRVLYPPSHSWRSTIPLPSKVPCAASSVIHPTPYLALATNNMAAFWTHFTLHNGFEDSSASLCLSVAYSDRY